MKRVDLLVLVMETVTELWQIIFMGWLVPVAARSKAWVCGPSPAGIVGSNPTGVRVCRECCVLSGRGLCDGLITRPEESYRLWCVVECYLEIL